MAIKLNHTGVGNITLTSDAAATLRIDGFKVWHENNDGAGSGLDADTVDTLQGSQLLRNDLNSQILNAAAFTMQSAGAPTLYINSTDGLHPAIQFNEIGAQAAYIQAWNTGLIIASTISDRPIKLNVNGQNGAIIVEPTGGRVLFGVAIGSDDGTNRVQVAGDGKFTGALDFASFGSTVPNFATAARGIVPASGGGTTNFLRADGSWAAPADTTRAPTDSPTFSGIVTTPASVVGGAGLRIPAGTAPSSPNVADLFHDSTRKSLASFETGITKYQSGVIFVATADKATSGTAAISMLGTGVGSLTLPANFFTVGKTLKIYMTGTLTTAAAPGTVTLIAKLGSVTICTSAATTPTVSLTNVQWTLEVSMTCRTTGASGTVVGTGRLTYGTTMATIAMPATAAVTVNTTTSNAVAVTSTNSIASGCIFTCRTAYVEVNV